jgi:hypothetical protein
VNSSSSNAPAPITKQIAKDPQGKKLRVDEVVLGQEVIERLKSWCYV